jgi:hypothetical protein
MNWNHFLSYKNYHLNRHHRYQLEVIFLFVAGFFLFFPYYMFIEEYGLDMQIWQWYFFFPWIGFYVLYSLWMRSKVPKKDRVTPLKRPVIHWILIGIFWLSFFHLSKINLERSQAVDIGFAIFTLFLADSYWDFKKFCFLLCKRKK